MYSKQTKWEDLYMVHWVPSGLDWFFIPRITLNWQPININQSKMLYLVFYVLYTISIKYLAANNNAMFLFEFDLSIEDWLIHA